MTDLKPLCVIIAIAGGIIAVVGFSAAFILDPVSAPQQAVRELRYVIAAIGAVVFALGTVAFQLEDGRVARRRDRGFDESLVTSGMMLSGKTRTCSHCMSRVRVESKVCRFCGRDIEPLSSSLPTET